LLRGYSQRKIASCLERSPSSIAREVRQGMTRKKYEPKKAHHKAYVRRWNTRFQFSVIHKNKSLEHYVIKKLKEGLAPQAISGRMKQEKQPWYASKTAIYDWLYSQYGQQYCTYLPYKRYGKRKRKDKKVKRELIPFRVNISKRGKLTIHDYEGDTVVSKKSKVALVVLHNPTTMYGDVRRVSTMKPHTVMLAFREMISLVKAKSLTFDNGQENRLHMNLNVKTFFCDPHAPWQKPGVENMNRYLRRFFPKKCDLAHYSEKEIALIVQKYNSIPREKLKWKTPHEVMCEKNLYVNKKDHEK
jgi:IS30 family transposase